MNTTTQALITDYEGTLAQVIKTCLQRDHWSPFPETSLQYPSYEEKFNQAVEKIKGLSGHNFHVTDRENKKWIAASDLKEISPYTRQSLGINYPDEDINQLFFDAEKAMNDGWKKTAPKDRLDVLMEVINTHFDQLPEIIAAVFHTTGQSFNMSYAGSGVNALDRGLEALAHASIAMSQVPATAIWQKSFNKTTIQLQKKYKLVPRGIAVCFTCASFPTWNAWPSIMASLATGNAVIVKPHPATVLPMALSVNIFRDILKKHGFNPDLVTLLVDTEKAPLGKILCSHPKANIIDFTGSASFGSWIEKNAYPKLTYTETSGCNTVMIESCHDLDGMLKSLATTMCMYSAQMCTSPQNIYIPQKGIATDQGHISAQELTKRLVEAIQQITESPKKSSMILATIQSEQTLSLINEYQQIATSKGYLALASRPYPHPEFTSARTATPLILKLTPEQRELYKEERFGPIYFIIECQDKHDLLTQVRRDVTEGGGITGFLYSSDEDFIEQAEDTYSQIGAQLTINLTGPMPLNFAAAYSDYHVTGLNPAGNACLTDLAFVSSRFRICQSRRPT